MTTELSETVCALCRVPVHTSEIVQVPGIGQICERCDEEREAPPANDEPEVDDVDEARAAAMPFGQVWLPKVPLRTH